MDVTVFRDDLGQPGSVAELEALSGRQRKIRLDAVRDACRDFIQGELRSQLEAVFRAVLAEGSHPPVEIALDSEGATGQRLRIRYARPRRRGRLRGPSSGSSPGRSRRLTRMRLGFFRPMSPATRPTPDSPFPTS